MGWNGSDGRGRSIVKPKKRKSKLPLMVWAIIIPLLLSVVYIHFFRSTCSDYETTERNLNITDAKPTISKQSARVRPRKKYQTKPKSVEEAVQRIEDSQEAIKITALSQTVKNVPRCIFKTSSEQVLSWLCRISPGEMPVPIPYLDDESSKQLISVLTRNNDVSPDDPVWVANLKEAVDAAKVEMSHFIKEGGDPNEFLQYYYDELLKAYETRNMAEEICYDLAEEDPETAKEFVNKINEKFSNQGILPISFEDKE